MKHPKSLFMTIVCFMLLFLSCCTKHQKLAESFSDDSETLERVKEALLKDKAFRSNYGSLVRVEKLSEKSIDALNQLRLRRLAYVTVYEGTCSLELEIMFGRNQHLEWGCERAESLQDGFIQVYPISGHWFYWVNTDFIG